MLQSYKTHNSKGNIIYTLNSIYKRMPHLDIDELIRFYFVFDSFEIENSYYDIFEAISKEILPRAFDISLSLNLSNDERSILVRLAKSDRKYFRAYNSMLKINASRAYAKLLSGGWINIEPTFEIRPKLKKGQKLPRYERRKLIQDKLHFSTNFLRFFFYFIEPNLKLINLGRNEDVMNIIMREFDIFCSLGFERLSCTLMAKKLGLNKMPQSLWVDKIEIDVFGFCEFGSIVAEVKYRGRKVCKSVLSQLEHKCKILGINPYLFAIISSSGFSKELLRFKSERVRLYDLEDFKELI